LPHLPKEESLKAQGPLKYTKALSINGAFMHCRIILNENSKSFGWPLSSYSLSSTLARLSWVMLLDELAMLLHQLLIWRAIFVHLKSELKLSRQ
jgi:hypothetical protein